MLAQLHGEDDAELGFAAGHARVSFVHFGERELFDHRAYAREFGEPQSVFGIRGDAGSPALNSFATANHEASLNLERVTAGTDDEKFAVGREAGDEIRHGFAARGGCEDDFGAAEFLQFRDGVGRGAVNVNMRAKLFGKRFAVSASADGGDAIAKLAGELHPQMAKAPYALNGDQIARERAAVTQSVERSDAGAKKRSGIGGIERVRHSGDSFCGNDRVFGVAAVEAKPSDFFVGAIDEITAAALRTGPVMTAVPPDANALAFVPSSDAGADFVDDSGNFVARRSRVNHAGPKAVFDKMVAEADAAGLHADANVTRGRLRNIAFLEFEVSTRLGDNGDFHFGHREFPRRWV